ncbi:hypothetical protein TrCOL_g3884, partial [Triparma columacea]
ASQRVVRRKAEGREKRHARKVEELEVVHGRHREEITEMESRVKGEEGILRASLMEDLESVKGELEDIKALEKQSRSELERAKAHAERERERVRLAEEQLRHTKEEEAKVRDELRSRDERLRALEEELRKGLLGVVREEKVHSASSVDGTSQAYDEMRGSLVLALPAGSHTVALQWRVFKDDDAVSWTSLNRVTLGYQGGEELLMLVNHDSNEPTLIIPEAKRINSTLEDTVSIVSGTNFISNINPTLTDEYNVGLTVSCTFG